MEKYNPSDLFNMEKRYLAPTLEVVTIEIEDAVLAFSGDGATLEQITPGVSMGDY